MASPHSNPHATPDDTVIRTLFEQALLLDDPERRTLLAQARAKHPSEVAEVESLLKHHHRTDVVLDRPPPAAEGGAKGAIPGTLSAPKTIGRYAVGVELGHGGMGVVYEAMQETPRRRVALKVVRPDLVTGSMLKRLAHEAEVLGRLRHPGIAQVYDAGTALDDRGIQRTFLAMELVRGRPILEAASARRLSVKQRLSLLAEVCDAIDHAHRRGVIHRDIKPGNILIEDEVSRDSAGSLGGLRVKVLDFGIARMAEDASGGATALTNAGQVVGTLAYMSPEQASGEAGAVDTRSDVYSLGAVLYELLCRQPPLPLGGTSLMGALSVIRTREPALAGKIVPALRGDPEAILAKALEKDPARRYASAAELGADIRRYLSDEPVLAHAQTGWYQFRKFARRNRAAVMAVSAILLVLVAGIMGTGWQAIKASRQRDRAEEQRVRAQESAAFLRRMISAATPEVARGRDLTVRELLTTAAKQLDADETIHPAVAADTHRTLGEAFWSIGDFLASIRHCEAAESLFVQMDGPDPREAFKVRSLRCTALAALGRAEETLQLSSEALTRAEKSLGEYDPYTIDLINALGAAYQITRPPQYDEAIKWARVALQRAEKTFGPDGMGTTQMLQNLGRAMMAAEGQSVSAETVEILRRAMVLRRRDMGEDHPRTLSAIQNYGAGLWLGGRNQEAVDVLTPAMPTTRRVLGRDHSTTVSMSSVLAAALTNLSRHEEALVLRREIYADHLKRGNPFEPMTVVSRHMLCENLFAAGHCDEGETLLKEVEQGVGTLGDGHMGDAVKRLRFDLARCRADLAGMERVLGELKGTNHEAELRRQFDDARKRILPDGR